MVELKEVAEATPESNNEKMPVESTMQADKNEAIPSNPGKSNNPFDEEESVENASASTQNPEKPQDESLHPIHENASEGNEAEASAVTQSAESAFPMADPGEAPADASKFPTDQPASSAEGNQPEGSAEPAGTAAIPSAGNSSSSAETFEKEELQRTNTESESNRSKEESANPDQQPGSDTGASPEDQTKSSKVDHEVKLILSEPSKGDDDALRTLSDQQTDISMVSATPVAEAIKINDSATSNDGEHVPENEVVPVGLKMPLQSEDTLPTAQLESLETSNPENVKKLDELTEIDKAETENSPATANDEITASVVELSKESSEPAQNDIALKAEIEKDSMFQDSNSPSALERTDDQICELETPKQATNQPSIETSEADVIKCTIASAEGVGKPRDDIKTGASNVIDDITLPLTVNQDAPSGENHAAQANSPEQMEQMNTQPMQQSNVDEDVRLLPAKSSQQVTNTEFESKDQILSCNGPVCDPLQEMESTSNVVQNISKVETLPPPPLLYKCDFNGANKLVPVNLLTEYQNLSDTLITEIKNEVIERVCQIFDEKGARGVSAIASNLPPVLEMEEDAPPMANQGEAFMLESEGESWVQFGGADVSESTAQIAEDDFFQQDLTPALFKASIPQPEKIEPEELPPLKASEHPANRAPPQELDNEFSGVMSPQLMELRAKLAETEKQLAEQKELIKAANEQALSAKQEAAHVSEELKKQKAEADVNASQIAILKQKYDGQLQKIETYSSAKARQEMSGEMNWKQQAMDAMQEVAQLKADMEVQLKQIRKEQDLLRAKQSETVVADTPASCACVIA